MTAVGADGPDLERQLEELREQQRAVGGVLRAVARSAGLQPVIDEVVEAARRLCGADYGALYLLDSAVLRLATHRGAPETADYDQRASACARPDDGCRAYCGDARAGADPEPFGAAHIALVETFAD